MLDSEGIAGKGLLKRGPVVEMLKFEGEKDNLFAEFPIGATIQDGGKRKRSDEWSCASSSSIKIKIKRNSKEKKYKIKKNR